MKMEKFEVGCKRKRGRPKLKLRYSVEEDLRKERLRKKEALKRKLRRATLQLTQSSLG